MNNEPTTETEQQLNLFNGETIVYEHEYYVVTVGLQVRNQVAGAPCFEPLYKVYNKFDRVLEIETTIRHQALTAADQFNASVQDWEMKMRMKANKVLVPKGAGQVVVP